MILLLRDIIAPGSLNVMLVLSFVLDGAELFHRILDFLLAHLGILSLLIIRLLFRVVIILCALLGVKVLHLSILFFDLSISLRQWHLNLSFIHVVWMIAQVHLLIVGSHIVVASNSGLDADFGTLSTLESFPIQSILNVGGAPGWTTAILFLLMKNRTGMRRVICIIRIDNCLGLRRQISILR